MNARRAEADDLPAVVELTSRAYEQYKALLGDDPVPVTTDYGPRIADGDVWMLEAPEPVGILVLEKCPDHLHIFSVAVSPEHQHGGIGRLLLSLAERIAVEGGLDRLTLCTNDRMTRNIGIYTRCGYVETGRRPNPRRPGWTLVDMEKRLAAGAELKRSA
jgi:ribosomal protein S18 acetylase RimI-like enzyme